MTAPPSLSVVVATHARAATLARMLDDLARVDRKGLDVEVVVVENGEPDATQAAVRARTGRLPLRYLHVPVANKSGALNAALDAGGLGEVVLFTDDDIRPDALWLRAVVTACVRWPERLVFGGRIEIVWPDGPLPGWARDDPWVRAFAFGHHDLGPSPREYEGGLFPYGPNCWARRGIFDAGRRFDEAFGPRAGSWIAGEETCLFWRLAAEGVRALHVPDAVVHHPVRPEQLARAWIRRRAWTEGLGRGALERPPRAAFRRRHPHLWRLEQRGRVARAALAYGATRLRPPTDAAVGASLRALRRLASQVAHLHPPPVDGTGAEPRT